MNQLKPAVDAMACEVLPLKPAGTSFEPFGLAHLDSAQEMPGCWVDRGDSRCSGAQQTFDWEEYAAASAGLWVCVAPWALVFQGAAATGMQVGFGATRSSRRRPYPGACAVRLPLARLERQEAPARLQPKRPVT